ncbi:TetR/AcrR family transcriptional regulator [Paenibacillus sp. MER 99-2]|uniref:TetR/AcrR family transcriptional regulator n=1 Tax=Paenibacillus sp. MER 99-2 TaxID=2939572 RepID=UPI00203F5BD2|nr:TetR/AcrR family transcriptional regulator [Paenibacillus sp. MER 99-2]MCM3172399.1 TetR/AcrR family transcriptional regulator [Paenibacillus sp. MER 99-2]
MPPKVEITKDKVLDAAFEMVREQGLDVLTARNIARRLHCSTQPIYSAYGNMDELKEELFDRAINFAIGTMKTYKNEQNSPAMNLILGCLIFSHQEKHLFRALYLSDYRAVYLSNHTDRLNEEIYVAFLQIDDRLQVIEETRARSMYLKIMTYWLGISTMINTNISELDLDEATRMLEEMYKLLSVKEGLMR